MITDEMVERAVEHYLLQAQTASLRTCIRAALEAALDGWEPIEGAEATWTPKSIVARFLVCGCTGCENAVGEAEYYGPDEGWSWAGTYGTYNGERIYPRLYQPLPAPPKQGEG